MVPQWAIRCGQSVRSSWLQLDWVISGAPQRCVAGSAGRSKPRVRVAHCAYIVRTAFTACSLRRGLRVCVAWVFGWSWRHVVPGSCLHHGVGRCCPRAPLGRSFTVSLAGLSSVVVRGPVAKAHSLSHGPTGCDLSVQALQLQERTGHAFKRGAMSAFAAASQTAPANSGAAVAGAHDAICDGRCKSYVGCTQLPQGKRHDVFGP